MKTADSKSHSGHTSRPAEPFFQSEKDRAFFAETLGEAPGTQGVVQRTPAFEGDEEAPAVAQRMPAFESENGALQAKLEGRTGGERSASVESAFFRPSGADGFSSRLTRPFFSPLPLQPRLIVGQPDDRYEQEAEAVADQVVSPPEKVHAPPPPVERREEDEDKAMPVQRQPEDGVQAGGRTGGEPLKPPVRGMLESRMGVDLGDVRVHSDPGAQKTAADLNARAFTHGSDIWLGPGESDSNLRLMAHEVTHVLQQGGAVRRQPLADDDREADALPVVEESPESSRSFINEESRAPAEPLSEGATGEVDAAKAETEATALEAPSGVRATAPEVESESAAAGESAEVEMTSAPEAPSETAPTADLGSPEETEVAPSPSESSEAEAVGPPAASAAEPEVERSSMDSLPVAGTGNSESSARPAGRVLEGENPLGPSMRARTERLEAEAEEVARKVGEGETVEVTATPAAPEVQFDLLSDIAGAAGRGIGWVTEKIIGPIRRVVSAGWEQVQNIGDRIRTAFRQAAESRPTSLFHLVFRTVVNLRRDLYAEALEAERQQHVAEEVPEGAAEGGGEGPAEPSLLEQADSVARTVEEGGETVFEINNEFWEGAVLGDFKENPTIWNTIGQIAIGFVPYAGQVADIRDLIAGIKKLHEGGWKDPWEWFNIVLIIIGFIPGIGDAIKAIGRGLKNSIRRGVRWVLTKADDIWRAIRRRMPQILDAARRFGRRLLDGARQLGRSLRRRAAALGRRIADSARRAWRRATGLARNLWQRGQRLGRSLLNRARSVVGRARGFVRRVAGGIGGAVRRALGSARNVAQRARDMARRAVRRSRTLVRALTRRARAAVQRARTFVRETVRRARARARALYRSARNRAVWAVRTAIDRARRLGAWAYNKARDTIRSGIRWVRAKAIPWLRARLARIRDRIKNWLKERWERLKERLGLKGTRPEFGVQYDEVINGKTIRQLDEEAGVLVNGRYTKNPTARRITDLHVTPGGRIKQEGQLLNGQYMYVVDLDGNIVVGSRTGQHMPHPTLIGGRDPRVRAAGIVEIRGGYIHSVDNASGHFRPSRSSLGEARDAFEAFREANPKSFSRTFEGYEDFTGRPYPYPY